MTANTAIEASRSPPCSGLDRSGRVIYVGSFGKTMLPALRIGYLVVPRTSGEAFAAGVTITGKLPPLLLQATLADFIEEGYFAAHLNRMRRIYAQTAARLHLGMRGPVGQWLDVQPNETGMQVTGRFKVTRSDISLRKARRLKGVDVMALSPQYRHSPPSAGIIFGLYRRRLIGAATGLGTPAQRVPGMSRSTIFLGVDRRSAAHIRTSKGASFRATRAAS